MNFSPVPADDQRFRSRVALVWSLAWGILAVLHVTQSIWLSGGQAYPGDLGDGRFNQLLFEHGHQALRGMATWASPGQFFPATNTLAYSDTHAGTLPIYTVLRRLGISREEAWQLFFIIVTALNVIAAFRLFRVLGVAKFLRGPVVFATTGSTMMVWLAGTHMQMLAVFPALLGWEQAVRWWDDRRPYRVVAGIGWLSWQFAAGPYSAFFAVVIGGFVGAVRFALGKTGSDSPTRKSTAEPRDWRAWLGSLLVFLIGTAMAFAVARIYADGLRAGHSRTIGEIIEGAPTILSWFTVPPVSYLYPPGWPGHQKNLVEHAWFAGFLAWILILFVLLVRKRLRQSAVGQWAVALALGSFGVLLFFTKWNADGAGLWVYLASHVGPLHAFRAIGRVAALMQFTLIGAGGLLLTWWTTTRRSRVIAAFCIGIVCLIAVENLSHDQPFLLRSVARARTDALVTAWRQAGDRPILAFAPGYTNQKDLWVELDAWSAALALHRVTINGYSGGIPTSHVGFAWNPTPEQARNLLSATGVPENEVSLVETLGEEAERRLDFQRLAERPLTTLKDFDLQPIGWVLFAPLEIFRVDDHLMYQFTPPAAVRFALPPSATRIAINVRMRNGSYDGPGHSDGVGLTWILRSRNAPEIELRHEPINPRDHPENRGMLRYDVELPAGEERVLVLRVDAGPRGDNSWDWPLFSGLRVK